MQESGQRFGTPAGRPMARPVAPTPIQRGNYGLPPRPQAPQPVPQQPAVAAPEPQPAPQPVAPPISMPAAAPPMPAPTSPQFMDIATRPAGTRPLPVFQPPAAEQQTAPTPVEQPAQRPLFTPSSAVKEEKPAAKTYHLPKKLTVVKYGLTGLAIVLMVVGGIRFMSAGSTAKDTIAVGAVSANDGRSMTIQFTATDGKLHKFATKSNRDMIPGTATEVAYRSGAPEATVRIVSVIKDARSLGMNLVLAGVLCLALAGVITTVGKIKARGKQRAAPLTTTATVSV